MHRLQKVYDRLYSAYGPQHWWPGDSAFEVLVGAVLVQSVSWKNVEKAISNLYAAEAMTPTAIHELSQAQLEQLVRPCGYYRVKARRLRNLIDWLMEQHDGSIEKMLQVETAELREQLLSINGIGPETADSILLYAAERPTFVVDAYTRRVLERHGWIKPGASYDDMKLLFEQNVVRETQFYNEYHALIVAVGHRHCSRTPKCTGCPLQKMLPRGGPR